MISEMRPKEKTVRSQCSKIHDSWALVSVFPFVDVLFVETREAGDYRGQNYKTYSKATPNLSTF